MGRESKTEPLDGSDFDEEFPDDSSDTELNVDDSEFDSDEQQLKGASFKTQLIDSNPSSTPPIPMDIEEEEDERRLSLGQEVCSSSR